MESSILPQEDLNLKTSYPPSSPPLDDTPLIDWEAFRNVLHWLEIDSDFITTTFMRRAEFLEKVRQERGDLIPCEMGSHTMDYWQFVMEVLRPVIEKLALDDESDDFQQIDMTSIHQIFHQLDPQFWGPSVEWTEEQVLSALHAIKTIREKLASQKEHWASFIQEMNPPHFPPYYQIIPNKNGCGSSYFVIDGEGIPRYVLKVVDEDIFCLNNQKGFASYELGDLVRDGIPLYRSAQTDALAYETACLIGVESITPRAWMGIYSSRNFFDITDHLRSEEYEKFIALTGEPSKEKLCSLQEFIHGARDLGEVYYDYEAEGKPFILDQEDLENVNLFLWTTYDTDAHIFNLMVYPKGKDLEGNIIWGLQKVDNGLCFPEKNTGFRNALAYIEQSAKQISSTLREKIANIPVEEICDRIKKYEMDAVIPAFRERIEKLQSFVTNTVSLTDINMFIWNEFERGSL